MAYVRPVIRLRENCRRIVRGGIWDGQAGRTVFQKSSDEAYKINVDVTDLLDGATITAAVSADGITASSSVAAGVVTLTCSAVSNVGDIDLTVTFSDGRIQQEYLRVEDPSCAGTDDYGLTRAST